MALSPDLHFYMEDFRYVSRQRREEEQRHSAAVDTRVDTEIYLLSLCLWLERSIDKLSTDVEATYKMKTNCPMALMEGKPISPERFRECAIIMDRYQDEQKRKEIVDRFIKKEFIWSVYFEVNELRRLLDKLLVLVKKKAEAYFGEWELDMRVGDLAKQGTTNMRQAMSESARQELVDARGKGSHKVLVGQWLGNSQSLIAFLAQEMHCFESHNGTVLQQVRIVMEKATQILSLEAMRHRPVSPPSLPIVVLVLGIEPELVERQLRDIIKENQPIYSERLYNTIKSITLAPGNRLLGLEKS